MGTGKAITIDDAYEDPRFNPSIDRESGYRTKAIICVPIKNTGNLPEGENSLGIPTEVGQVIGAVQMLNKKDGKPFTDVDVNLLNSVSQTMGSAIQHWAQEKFTKDGLESAVIGLKKLEKQLHETKSLNVDLVATKSRQEQLLETSKTLAAELSLDHLFSNVVEKTRTLLNADRATLWIIDPVNNELFSKIAKGTSEIRIPRGKGIAGICAESGEVINIKDAYSDDRFDSSTDKKTHYVTKSILCAPIVSADGDIIGAAQAINQAEGAFNENHEKWVFWGDGCPFACLF